LDESVLLLVPSPPNGGKEEGIIGLDRGVVPEGSNAASKEKSHKRREKLVGLLAGERLVGKGELTPPTMIVLPPEGK
jgi:hypothetical protein